MADYNTKTKYYFYKLYNDFFDIDVIEHLEIETAHLGLKLVKLK